jgi:glycosyltransferase involved in cell wall biosynthesis
MIVCNIRILSAPLTGVQRYTMEILQRWPEADTIRTVKPSELFAGRLGHVWEQAVLPLHARGHLLWSPAGTGPIHIANQVVTVHDIAPIDCALGYSPAFSRWYTFVWRHLLPRARGLISVSEFTKRRLIEQFNIPPASIHVTPLGVDHTRFVPQPADKIAALRRKLSLPENFVLFVGALSARKNIVRLIEAWRNVRAPDCHLVIAGGRGHSHVLAGTSSPEVTHNTLLLDRIDDADLPTLIAAARVFAYPSLYEGFGLPPIEAMACGTPCMVANATALPEVAGDAALLVDPLDVADISRGLTRLLTDEALRADLRAKGLKRAATFTWEQTAAKTYEILKHYS